MRWPLWRVAVAERSMEPSLRPGDWLLVWRGLRPARPPRIRAGQIVVARHPGRADFLLVKRAVRRAEDGWWLGSDNHGAWAVDSRSFGAVPGEFIRGRVLLRYRRGPAVVTSDGRTPHGRTPHGRTPQGPAPPGPAPGGPAPAAEAGTAEDPRPQERGGDPRAGG
jgi:nickel-type superoxide dismutase maturation protease